MRIDRSPTKEIINQVKYHDGGRTEVLAARRTQEATVYLGDHENGSVRVVVQSRFAVTPDSNPTVHNDVTFIKDPAREEGVTDLTDQMDILFAVAGNIIPCGVCLLAKKGTCGLTRMNVESRFTDSFDTSSQKVAGLTHGQELRAGTQASDVLCVQP